MLFIIIGVALLVGALFGPALGLKLYQTGRPGGRGGEDASIGGRLATGILGIALIVIGVSERWNR